MSCTALGANPALQEILWCAVQLGAGTWVIAAALMFILMFYALYKMKLPFLVTIPIGLMLLYVFAGAGNQELAIGGFQSFSLILQVVAVFGGIVFVLLFWKLRR